MAWMKFFLKFCRRKFCSMLFGSERVNLLKMFFFSNSPVHDKATPEEQSNHGKQYFAFSFFQLNYL